VLLNPLTFLHSPNPHIANVNHLLTVTMSPVILPLAQNYVETVFLDPDSPALSPSPVKLAHVVIPVVHSVRS
jgi:hypothetical protein